MTQRAQNFCLGLSLGSGFGVISSTEARHLEHLQGSKSQWAAQRKTVVAVGWPSSLDHVSPVEFFLDNQ